MTRTHYTCKWAERELQGKSVIRERMCGGSVKLVFLLLVSWSAAGSDVRIIALRHSCGMDRAESLRMRWLRQASLLIQTIQSGVCQVTRSVSSGFFEDFLTNSLLTSSTQWMTLSHLPRIGKQSRILKTVFPERRKQAIVHYVIPLQRKTFTLGWADSKDSVSRQRAWPVPLHGAFNGAFISSLIPLGMITIEAIGKQDVYNKTISVQ